MKYLLAAFVFFLAAPAAAQQVCMPYENFKKQIERAHKERLIFRGIDAGGWVVEVWMSASDSWTMTRTNPSGTSCLVDTGEGAVQFEWKLPGTAA